MQPLPPAGSLDSVEACNLRHELYALNLELPVELQEQLIGIHARGELMQRNKMHPWTIVEDGRLLEQHVDGEATVRIAIGRRSYGSVKRRLLRLKRHISYTHYAFYQARCDPEAPSLQLQYNTWTPIAADRAIPREAEVDWLNGTARAPASWELRLDSSRFCFVHSESRQPLHVNASDVFSLEDLRPDMSIRTVLHHVSKWMSTSVSSAVAQAVDHRALRLAILPSGAQLPAMHATSRNYSKGQHVQYRSQDGKLHAATIQSVDGHAKPTRYTISIDADQRRVPASSLSTSKPRVPLSRDTVAASQASDQPLKVGLQVWYSQDAAADVMNELCEPCTEDDDDADIGLRLGTPTASRTAPPAPSRACINATDDDGYCVITLEGDACDTTALQLTPMPATPAPSPPVQPWPQEAPKIIDLDETVASAKLFNQMARVVIVTADVQDYWERWYVPPQTARPRQSHRSPALLACYHVRLAGVKSRIRRTIHARAHQSTSSSSITSQRPTTQCMLMRRISTRTSNGISSRRTFSMLQLR